MPFRRAVVLGSGADGLQFARAAQAAQLDVVLIEPDHHAAERAAHFLGRTGVRVATDWDEARGADLCYIGLEDPQPTERELLARPLSDLAPDAVLIGDDADTLTALTSDKQRSAGFHLVAPAHIRELVELTPRDEPAGDITERLSALAQRMGKHVLRTGRSGVSVHKRLLMRLLEAADTLLLDGATPWAIDEAMTGFGFDLGVYEAQDLIGMDVAYAARKRLGVTRDPRRRYSPVADRMVEEGRLGVKIGVGWYRYPGGGGAVIDPLVEDLIREEAWFAQVEQRDFNDKEITDRLLLSLIHEGCALLNEGACDGATIELAAVAGLGFPAGKGGPLGMARELGPDWLQARMVDATAEDPLTWQSGPTLQSLLKKA